MFKSGWKTRNQANLEAIAYNPNIAENLALDQDYCIRGMIYSKATNLYLDYDLYVLEIKNGTKL